MPCSCASRPTGGAGLRFEEERISSLGGELEIIGEQTRVYATD